MFTLVLLAALLTFSCRQMSQEEINQFISGSERLRSLDRFCVDLPKPSGSKFVYKKLAGNSERAYISYYFQTDASFSVVEEFVTYHLERDGWTRIDSWRADGSSQSGLIKYRKLERSIDVEQVALPNADYVIGCGEELAK